MEVVIISKETIKPSSPTPPHLKTFKVSLIDKMHASTWYIPFTTYYSIKHPDDHVDSHHERIKLSLAKTLTRFYPLAGRPNDDDRTIDCNDKGVLFLTARLNRHLVDLLKPPMLEEFHKLLPPWPSICPDVDDSASDRGALIGIQLNVFECGSIALSICMTHLICDAASMAAFLKCWSEISRGSQDHQAYPCFPPVELFPLGDDDVVEPFSYFMEKSLLREGTGSNRRFVFDSKSISALREKARSERVPNPTRVEAVSMFIWKHCMAASAQVWGIHQPSLLSITVDLRRRMAPLLSEYSCGNINWKPMITFNGRSSADHDEMDISGLVRLFRITMEENSQNIVPNLKKNGGPAELVKYIEELREKCKDTNLNPYNFTSWCGMGFTNVDFGWGKPVWYCCTIGAEDLPSFAKNNIILIDSDDGEKFELWLILDKREMIALENDREFLAFASPNPPLII